MRYLLFAFDDDYPNGGWGDFAGCYQQIAVAMKRAAEIERDDWHIVDIETLQIVADRFTEPDPSLP